MNADLEIQMIAVLTAVSCGVPGMFLVLRRLSMLSDAITHTVLLGIVLAFFVVGDLSSPLLLCGAAVMGVVTVWMTETVTKTRLVAEDSAVGIVFPLLFSVAVILITQFASSVHLDTDAVLLGELAFAPFQRMVMFGRDIGAKGIYTALGMLAVNLLMVLVFYKELKLAAFDPVQAAVLGFAPGALYYGVMTLASLTAVSAFEAVGAVLVVAFMIGPPAAACQLTDDLGKAIWISAGLGAASGIGGFWLAKGLDVSISGSMAVVTGGLFFLSLLLAPRRKRGKMKRNENNT